MAPPAFLIRLVFSTARAIQSLLDRALPAELALFDRGFSVARTATLGLAARLKLADLLEVQPMSSAELAAKLGADADGMHRLMRTLVSFGVFALENGRFHNNRLSQPLRSDSKNTVRHFIEYLGSPSNIRAYTDLEGAVRSKKSAFERVHGKDVWTWFGEHPDEGATFAGAMTDGTTRDAPALAAGWRFGELTRLCDVGGGRGQLLAEVVAKNPKLQGVLFDEQRVLDLAPPLLESRGVTDRVERAAGSFFESVPGGCDGYMMKDILHDWGDPQCVTILGHIRRVAKVGTRLFLFETLVEPDETLHPLPLIDLHMMMVCDGGRQRSRAEFDALLGKCGFRLDEVVSLAAIHSLVVATAI
jgi:hypothetical protein